MPGAVPGTQRWIVHFARRGFDLSEFRRAIYARRPAAEVEAIVARLENACRQDQAAFVERLERLGGRVVSQWWLINACCVDVPPGALEKLRRLPNVARLEPDRVWYPVIKTATNAKNHNADHVQQVLKIDGRGVTAAVMDTGIDQAMGSSGRPHRMLYPNGDPANKTGGGIGGSRLVLNRRIGRLGPDDPHGHGTGVTSIVAGAGWSTARADKGHAFGAKVAGYAIANQVQGGATTTQVMAQAWQQMAADKARYGIVAANLSYSGTPNPLDASQKALDAAALNADILVCVAAGNSGASTRTSQSAANGLAVAAVNPDRHTVASFSSRGPLSGDPQRFYPDIAGCGVSTVMARRDAETSDFVASGTSMASPQVCGAATLVRAANPKLTAVETKAILLASALDISDKNGSLNRNAYGMGLLRDDRAVAIARTPGAYGTAMLTPASRSFETSIDVRRGKSYAVAIAWHRQDLNSTQWSNVDLEVRDGQTVLAASRTPRNLYEMVRFLSPRTGKLTVRVAGTTLASGVARLPVAFAWTEAPGKPITGTYTVYGKGCKGTGSSPGGLCASENTTGISLNLAGFAGNDYAIEVIAPRALTVGNFELFMASRRPGSVTLSTSVWSADAAGKPSGVLRTGTMTVGPGAGWARSVVSPPLAVPGGTRFFIGFKNPNPSVTLPIVFALGGKNSTVWTKGLFGWGRTLFRFPWAWKVNCIGTSNAVPSLSGSGEPRVGGSFRVVLGGARANASATLLTGASDRTWGGVALPFDLTPFGAPGCAVLASGEIDLGVRADAGGAASAVLTVPNLRDLVGGRVYNQFVVVDPRANGLGLAFSNGGVAMIGGTP